MNLPDCGTFNTVKPAMQFVSCDTFQLLQVLRYRALNGDLFEIPFIHDGDAVLSFLTDLGSKPLWSVELVGDRCDELTNDYIHHDGLFVRKTVIRGGVIVPIDFDYTQRALEEMMTISGSSFFKRDEILAGVAIGGRDMFNNRAPLDVTKITVANPTEDFAVMTVRCTPDFEAA